MLFYIFPLALYGIFFFRLKYLWEIVSGTFSFLFYSPSYLNLLNIYALCRIDDISWGTKGLDASVGGKNAKLKDTWKIVKMMDVAKFFFWNIIIGSLFIVFDSYLLIKFLVTLILLVLFTLIQAIKIIIGIVYLIKYRCITSKKNKVDRETPFSQEEDPLEKPEMKMHIYEVIDTFDSSLREEIKYAFQMAAEEKEEEIEEEEAEEPAPLEPRVSKKPEQDRFTALMKGDMHMEPGTGRVSRQVMQAFQSNKFQNIRKAN